MSINHGFHYCSLFPTSIPDVHLPGDQWPCGSGADQEGYPRHKS